MPLAIDERHLALSLSHTEFVHQVRILNHGGCNFFQRTHDPLSGMSQGPELFLTKKMWSERDTNGPLAVEQPFFAHGAVQFFEHDR